MPDEDLLVDRLAAALSDFSAAGLVLTGELSFVRPLTPGLVEAQLHIARRQNGVPGHISLKPVRVTHENKLVYLPRKDTGAVCITCGSPDLRWAGACQVCQACGSSNGCG